MSDDYLSILEVAPGLPTTTPLVKRVISLLSEIEYRRTGTWEILLGEDQGVPYVQVRCQRLDVVTGKMGWGAGGKYRVSEHATDSEIVQATFGLFKAYEEHEVRENFYWEGARIFGPHIDIRAMHSVANKFDARTAVEQARREGFPSPRVGTLD